MDDCTSKDSIFDVVGGQVFDAAGFNVIASYADCNDIYGGNHWRKSRDDSQLARRGPVSKR